MAVAALAASCCATLHAQRAASSAQASCSPRSHPMQLCAGSHVSSARASMVHVQRHAPVQRCWATAGEHPEEEAATGEAEENVLTPEEDWTVPGGYQDSLSSNTPLGRALREACDELDALGSAEAETLDKANELLAKLGYRVPQPAPVDAEGGQAEQSE